MLCGLLAFNTYFEMYFAPAFARADFVFTLAVLGMPSIVFWGYFAAATLLVVGLLKVIEDELPQAHGLNKVMPIGRLCFAIPMAVFGTEHFTITTDIATMVPSWIPAHTFWVYLVGVALIAAALSITVKMQSRLSATLLGVMFCLFVVLMDIPAAVADPSDRFSWTLALRELAFGSGALAFAGAQMRAQRARGGPALVTFARFVIGIAAVFYGVEHFLHPTLATGVPLQKIMPEWIPGRLFWAYAAGAVLVASGACLVANKKARQAAAYLGVIILLLVLFEYLPMLIAGPKDIVNVNYFFDTLAFGGAVLLLADACGERSKART
jgi:uncharacterized membrane protein